METENGLRKDKFGRESWDERQRMEEGEVRLKSQSTGNLISRKVVEVADLGRVAEDRGSERFGLWALGFGLCVEYGRSRPGVAAAQHRG